VEPTRDEIIEFIKNMPDKYDYRYYLDFCKSQDYTPLPFVFFASLADPLPSPPVFAVGVPASGTLPIGAVVAGEIRSVGLGDTVAKVTKATGLDELSKLYTRITGKPCGCSERQDALNKLFPYVKEEN
jgi:hypothetical protein